MQELLLPRKVDAEAHLDMVRLTFGTEVPVVPYLTAFEICAGLRLACKMAMRTEGNKVGLWRDLAMIMRETLNLRPSRKFRRSRLHSNVSDWRVQYVPLSPLVVLTFDPWPSGRRLTVKIHYSDGFQFYTQLRTQARIAKAWAGDGSRIWNSRSYLSSGEDDYKRGYS